MTRSHAATEPRTLTVEEAAKVLGISRQRAYEAARSGELPAIRIGRRLLVPRVALDRLLDPENDSRPAGQPSANHSFAQSGGRDAFEG